MRSEKKAYKITLGEEATPDQFVVCAIGVGESKPYIYHLLSVVECNYHVYSVLAF